MIKKLSDIVLSAKAQGPKRLVAAYANDSHTILAIYNAVKEGIVNATLIGNKDQIKEVCIQHGINYDIFKIIEESVDTKCVAMAIAMINSGEADILMKGLVSTDKYMRGILSREGGLVPPKAVLSHVAVMEIPAYRKLLIISDVAVIPAPDLAQKVAITRYVIGVAKTLGIESPKVALITPTEQMLAGIPSCIDAAIISKMAERGQITGAIVDGPLALDVAIDPETVATKKLVSPVGGDADCLVFPNIESANVFFKCATKMMNGSLAAMVMGANKPCVLTSRGDSEASKLYSIALAALSVK